MCLNWPMPMLAVSPSPLTPMPFRVEVAEQRAGRQRGHAAVQAVEAKGAVQEIGRALAGAADAAEFDHVFGHDIQLVAGRDDLAGDRIVSAALAQGAWACRGNRFW